jgi:hypothetical protein
MSSHLTDTDSIDLTDNAGNLEARVRLADSTLAVAAGGLKVRVSVTPENALMYGGDGGLYVRQGTAKTISHANTGPQVLGIVGINSNVFNSGFRPGQDESVYFSQNVATESQPLAAMVELPWAFSVTNPSTGPMALLVDYGVSENITMLIHRDQFVTLRTEISVNGGAWHTYGEVGVNDSGSSSVAPGPYIDLRMASPRGSTSRLLAAAETIEFRMRTLLVWRTALLPASGTVSNFYFRNHEIMAFGVAA